MPRELPKAGIVLADSWQRVFTRRRRAIVSVGIALSGLLLVFSVFNIAYAGKILPGLTVGNIAAGGMTPEELRAALHENTQKLTEASLTVTVDGQNFTVKPVADWELAYDIDATVKAAALFGRRDGLGKIIKEQFLAGLGRGNIEANYSLDRTAYRNFLTKVTETVETPEQDARLVLDNGELAVEPDKIGRRLPDGALEDRTHRALSGLAFDKIELSLQEARPAVTTAQAQSISTEVWRSVSQELTLNFQNEKFVIPTAALLEFIEMAASADSANGVLAIVSEPKVIQYLESIAGEIEQPAVDARLTIQDGRATIFTPSQDGYRVKREEAAKSIAEAMLSRRHNTAVTTIELPVEVTKAAVRTETINDLGIKGLLGKATTSFTGSPTNRVHNISVGARSFNGLLIKPGETFSAVKALGTIDASTGYKAELVIKEDRLIPETGGGLCQVSTTLFRAALNTGLPIVERKSHSFRVRYYEPPIGMDATIYDPAPDLKFTNDTPGYILIQTRVEGSRLTFEFYGTSDGREVTVTTPVVYNITPPPAEIVEIVDTSLQPGERKKIESAVPGADAKFTYTVKRDGEVIFARTFLSHYVAWQEKWKVGPTAPPTEPVPAEPTS